MGTLKLISLTALTAGLLAGQSFGAGTVTSPIDVGSVVPVISDTYGLQGQGQLSIVTVDDVDYSGMGPQPPAIQPGGGGVRLAL